MRLILGLLPVVVFSQATMQNYTYSISTLAGTNWNGDGRPGTEAHLLSAKGIAVAPDGTIYVSDSADHKVRRIKTSGIIDTFAGIGRPGFTGDDEPVSKAPLSEPYGLALDSQGNLYIADLGNQRVRKLRPDGRLETVAGGGILKPDPGRGAIPALEARLEGPRAVAVDPSGNVYIADMYGHRIYQVTPGGMLTVIAGTGEPEDSGLGEDGRDALRSGFQFPTGLALDSRGALYIVSSNANVVRKLVGGTVTRVRDRFRSTEIFPGFLTGIAIDAHDRLYVCNGDEVVVMSPEGIKESLKLSGWAVAASRDGNVYTAHGSLVWKAAGAIPQIIAGTSRGPGAGDGYDKQRWRFARPVSAVRDAGGHVLISDRLNGRIRRISPAGELTTITLRLPLPGPMALDPQSRLHVAEDHKIFRVDLTGYTSKIFESQIYDQALKRFPPVTAMTFDKAGNLFFAMAGRIYRITPEGHASVQAGGGFNREDGPALLTLLDNPVGLDFDSAGALYFVEQKGTIRRLYGSRITTVMGVEARGACSLRIGSDNSMYVTTCAQNHQVLRIWPDGRWVPIAGAGYPEIGAEKGNALSEPLHTPTDAVPLADGSVLVTESGNDRIRLLTPEDDSTIAPPAELTHAPMTVRHAATLVFSDVAPGQLVYVRTEGINATHGITFSGQPALVLSTAEGQLTVRIPTSLPTGPAEVAVTEGKAVKTRMAVNIVNACPGVLTSQGGRGQALALNEDGTLNSTVNPAGRGAILSIYLTGEGDNVSTPKVRIAGFAADVVWHGRAPDLPGLYQVNVRTPGGFSPSGVVSLEMEVNGAPTQAGVTLVSK